MQASVTVIFFEPKIDNIAGCSAIKKLQQLVLLRLLRRELHGHRWDRQIEADVKAGRLDAAGKRADEVFAAGRCTHFLAHRAVGTLLFF